jgi:hypothetical protein
VLQDVNKKILKAVLRWRRDLHRRGNRGRKRRRGRPTKAQKRQRQKQDKKHKEKAKFIFQRRHLIVKRRDKMKDQEREDLATMLKDLPALTVLRDFADAMQRLFAAEQTEAQARGRWRRLQQNEKYLAVPGLKSVLETVLVQEKFVKMIAFLRNPAASKVRTNNHVERCNRKLRYWEKVRYKWRRRRTLVRFLVLAMDHWWQQKLPSLEADQAATKPKLAKRKRKHVSNRQPSDQSCSSCPEPAQPDKRRKAA